MKIEFWKHKALLIVFAIVTTLSMALVIMFICLMAIKKIDIETGFMGSGIFLIIVAIAIIGEARQLFSKVIFSSEGVEWKYFNKQMLFIEWFEITEVKETFKGKMSLLAFFRGKDKIEMEVYKKMYKTIMLICPNDSVKSQVRNLPFLTNK